MTLEEALAELPAGERATNTTVTYELRLDGDLSEDQVRDEVRRHYPAFRRVTAHRRLESRNTVGKVLMPAEWQIQVTLRKEW